MTGQSTD